MDWTVFPFLHTFPSNDPSKSTWVAKTCAACPNTVQILRSIPGIRTALFSRMGGNTKVKPLHIHSSFKVFLLLYNC